MWVEVKSWFITWKIKVSSLETMYCNSSSISSVSVHNISDIIGNKKGTSNLVAMFKYTQKWFRFCKQMNGFYLCRNGSNTKYITSTVISDGSLWIYNVFPTISIVVTQHVCHNIFIAFMIPGTLLVFMHV